jgi:hypothetical protein
MMVRFPKGKLVYTRFILADIIGGCTKLSRILYLLIVNKIG